MNLWITPQNLPHLCVGQVIRNTCPIGAGGRSGAEPPIWHIVAGQSPNDLPHSQMGQVWGRSHGHLPHLPPSLPKGQRVGQA